MTTWYLACGLTFGLCWPFGNATASSYEARQAELWQQADRICTLYEDEPLSRQDRACLKRELLTRELKGQQWCFIEHGRFWRPCR